MVPILILIGLEALGMFMTIYAFWIVRVFGHLDFAEARLGPGGSYTFWRLVGLAIIIFSPICYRSGIFGALTAPSAPPAE